MKNIRTEIKNGELVIKVKLNGNFGLSKSGKNLIIATTSGNADVDGAPDVKMGLNIYKSA